MDQWLQKAHRFAGWIVALGVVQMVLGGLVLGAPLAGGLSVVMVIGIAMILGGAARLVAAFFAESFGSGALAFLWGLLVASSGFFLFTNSGVGLLTITLVLSMVFFANGLTESIVAFQVKPASGWGWMLTGGIVSVLLAIMIWREFPLSGLWLVGTMVGVNLFFNGVSTMTIGFAARRVTRQAQ